MQDPSVVTFSFHFIPRSLNGSVPCHEKCLGLEVWRFEVLSQFCGNSMFGHGGLAKRTGALGVTILSVGFFETE